MRSIGLVTLALVLFAAFVFVVGVQPPRLSDPLSPPPQPPARFQQADAWVPDRLGADIVFFTGSMTSPTGRRMLVWLVQFPGTTFTTDGHSYVASAGSLIGVTINLKDPSYVGPVYLRQGGHRWVLVLTQVQPPLPDLRLQGRPPKAGGPSPAGI